MVRLLRLKAMKVDAQLVAFNPTMVRLLRGLIGKTAITHCFQSHNGAIAARNLLKTLEEAQRTFNPTMVRLLQTKHQNSHANQGGFNPTMVRLLLPCRSRLCKAYKGFNPTMVRLLLVDEFTPSSDSEQVSIPQWCDCCVNTSGG